MSRQGWLRLWLTIGGLLFLFWAFFMLFLPTTGHDMMAARQPYDPATTRMFGAALLALVVGAAMGLRDPEDAYKEVSHLLAGAFSIIFLVALYALVVGDMDSTTATWGSLIVDGVVALGLILFRP